MSRVRKHLIVPSLCIAALVLGGCRAPTTTDVPLTFQPTAPATETPFEPTALPPAPETLIVCVAEQPESLFIYHPDVLYGQGSPAAHAVLQALYDGPIDLIDYRAEAVILEDLPTIENGGVSLQAVTVGENEVFFNPLALQPENLRTGDRYLPSGCHSPECLETYTGGEVQMDQLVVEFTLQEGIVWSDGESLKASDSRFSFVLDRSGELPTTKFLVDRTSDYRVMDERSVRWVGIPGFMDGDYMTNFWTPLPEHLLGAIPPADLLAAEAVNRSPLGWGPYVISSWTNGDLALIPNQRYEGYENNSPPFDNLIFRFISERGDAAIQQILTDECDVVDESLLDQADLSSARSLMDEGRLALWSVSDAAVVRLDFNLATVESGRPAYFQDLRTRQAVAQCIDRAEIQSILTGEEGALPSTYFNPEHPAFSSELELVTYDPETGKALLDEIGWVLDEDNPDAPRVAFGVPGVRMATPLSLRLLSADSEAMLAVASMIKDDLEACGIEVELNSLPEQELAQPWPDGPVFGRRFDLVVWSWPEWISPLCEMFASWEIPSNTQPYGINATGYQSSAYDAACQRLFLSVPGMPGYQKALVETQQIFNQDLPALPLYQPLRWVLSDSETCGLSVDSIATSALWNLEVLDSGDSCP